MAGDQNPWGYKTLNGNSVLLEVTKAWQDSGFGALMVSVEVFHLEWSPSSLVIHQKTNKKKSMVALASRRQLQRVWIWIRLALCSDIHDNSRFLFASLCQALKRGFSPCTLRAAFQFRLGWKCFPSERDFFFTTVRQTKPAMLIYYNTREKGVIFREVLTEKWWQSWQSFPLCHIV